MLQRCKGGQTVDIDKRLISYFIQGQQRCRGGKEIFYTVVRGNTEIGGGGLFYSEARGNTDLQSKRNLLTQYSGVKTCRKRRE